MTNIQASFDRRVRKIIEKDVTVKDFPEIHLEEGLEGGRENHCGKYGIHQNPS